MFNEACYDCHSNQTAFPWYTYIQPLGWWINGHIKGGKNKANYHNYGTLDKRAKNHLIEETIEVLENKRMPLKSYTWLHPKAKLSDADKTNMINWLNSLVEE